MMPSRAWPSQLSDHLVLLYHLVKEKFDIVHGEDGPAVIHVLLEVPLQVFEDESEGLVSVDDVMQSH